MKTWVGCIVLVLQWVHFAQADKVYFVGGDKEAGEQMAASADGQWVKGLSKAFARAADTLATGGEMNVEIRVAGGDYDGDLGSGGYTIPRLNNPESTLTIKGGYLEDFSSRDPFKYPTQIVTDAGRSQPLWQFTKNSVIGSLVVDGLLFDCVGSNAYDAKTNSLLKRGSSTHTFFDFEMLETNYLGFHNCIFMNSAHRVMETLIRAQSDDAEIRFYNSIFVNCIIPLKLDTARFRHKPQQIAIDHCSFLINWAFNPDPDTGVPAAIEIGPADAATEIVITNNLFYSNFGGAILALNLKMPGLTINNNNFIGNGLLHGLPEPGAAAMIVTAGGRKQPIDVDTIEEIAAVNEAEGNVSIAPGIPLTLGEVQAVDASKVRVEEDWENEVRRLLGIDLQGGTVVIKDFAPKKVYDPNNPPFAVREEAKRYGASPGLLK